MQYCEQDLASLLDNMQKPFTEAQVNCKLWFFSLTVWHNNSDIANAAAEMLCVGYFQYVNVGHWFVFLQGWEKWFKSKNI